MGMKKDQKVGRREEEGKVEEGRGRKSEEKGKEIETGHQIAFMCRTKVEVTKIHRSK